MNIRISGVVLYITLFVCGISIGIPAEAKHDLVFGVHPFKKPSKIYKMFKPLTEQLSKMTGYNVKIVIGKSYDDILDKYRKGEVDFGYFGPASYVQARKESGVVPLARIMMNGKGAFKGVIVVRNNSKIKSLSDLKGKKFAFGDKASTLSHFVPHHMLMEKNIYLKNLKYYAFTGNHDNVALNVLNGTFHAGGLKPAVANQYLAKGLKILVESEWIPEHLFAASKHLSEKQRNKLLTALLKVDISVLKAIKGAITGVEPAKDADYDKLRQIINEVNHKDPAK